MEVPFEPVLQRQLEDIAQASGRNATELIQDAVADYVDDLEETRAMLEERYQDVISGRVQGIPGEEVFAKLRARSAARKRLQGNETV